MKIAIDLDDVLADTKRSVLDFYIRNYESATGVSKIDHSSYWAFLGETREESNRKFFEFTKTPEFDLIKPIAGAKAAMKKLARKHELYIITGRPFFVEESTRRWVTVHFPNIFREIYFTNDRMDQSDLSAYWGRPKAEICTEIGAEVLVDDLHGYIKESNHLTVFLMDKPWNQAETESHVIRVFGWDDLISRI